MSLPSEYRQLLELVSRLPMDDEELTPEATAAILEAERSVGNGNAISHDEMLREFGLK